MLSERELVLVAVSVVSDETHFVVGLPELPKSYKVRCTSSMEEANLLVETGGFFGEMLQQFELFKRHGWTVLKYEPYQLLHLNLDLTTKGEIVRAALKQVASLYVEGRQAVSGYDENFAKKVLEIVVRDFPAKKQLIDLKTELVPEPSDAELLVALEALLSEGYIEGKALYESTTGRKSLAILAQITSTKAGRDFLKPRQSDPSASFKQVNFHGPVGIVGDNASGTVVFNQQWIATAPEPDWKSLAQALSDAMSLKANSAATSADFGELASLAKAKEEAERANRSGFLDAVLKGGQNLMPILAKAGAHGLIAFLEQHYGWKLS